MGIQAQYFEPFRRLHGIERPAVVSALRSGARIERAGGRIWAEIRAIYDSAPCKRKAGV